MAYPLRKVIQVIVTGELHGKTYHHLSLLECGHYVSPSSDFYGLTAPVRQRCRQCFEANQKENDI